MDRKTRSELRDRRKELSRREADLERRSRAVREREEDLCQRERTIPEREEHLFQRERAVSEREGDLEQKEGALVFREDEVAKREYEVQDYVVKKGMANFYWSIISVSHELTDGNLRAASSRLADAIRSQIEKPYLRDDTRPTMRSVADSLDTFSDNCN